MPTVTKSDLPTFYLLFPEFSGGDSVPVADGTAVDVALTPSAVDTVVSADATITTMVGADTVTFTNAANVDTTIGESTIPGTNWYWGVGDATDTDYWGVSSAIFRFVHDGAYVAIPPRAQWSNLPQNIIAATNRNAGVPTFTSGSRDVAIQCFIDLAKDIHANYRRPTSELYLAAHYFALSLRDTTSADARATVESETIGPYEVEYQRVADKSKTIRNAYLETTKYGRIYMQLETRFPTTRARPLNYVKS